MYAYDKLYLDVAQTALAYYQWETGLSFSDINTTVSIDKVRDLYSTYHEMDKRQFVDKMEELLDK